METSDFLRSFAQENVSFETKVVKSSQVGQNYWSVMIFAASDQYITESGLTYVETISQLTDITGVLTVDADTYGEYTNGILQSWLYDLYCSGFTGDTFIVLLGNTDDITEDIMSEAYEYLKPYAYHKTLCITEDTETTTEDDSGNEVAETVTSLNTDLAVAFAKLCANDHQLLSSAPYYPYTTETPSDSSTDALYTALTEAETDAFMSAYQDTTRNAALVSLGIALSSTNNSGTCVGNGFDMTATSYLNCSGPDGTSLVKAVRTYLESINVQSWKWVGNNTNNVAALGDKTIRGQVVGADWIVSYITYMCKVKIAELLTSGNFLKNEANYTKILNVLGTYLSLFSQSGRLESTKITAPGFESLPDTDGGDTITISNAWEASYVDHLRYVDITGTLYIEV